MLNLAELYLIIHNILSLFNNHLFASNGAVHKIEAAAPSGAAANLFNPVFFPC
jgi:hypothetical protein